MTTRLATALLAGIATVSVAAPAYAGTEYFYDAAGRLIKVVYSNGVVIEYRYDAAGNRQQVTTATVPNRLPVARNDTASVATSGTVDITVLANDSDPDRDTLTITSVGTPTSGSAAILSGPARVRYTAPAAVGTYTFTYSISDGHSHTASATVTVLVGGGNQAPVARNDTYTVDVGSSTLLFVLGNDTDANSHPLTITSASSTTAGIVAVTPGGGSVTFDAPAASGLYEFTYTISDGHGGTASANVTVNARSPDDNTPECPPLQLCES